MSRRHWSPTDHEEYAALLEDSFSQGMNSHERIDAFEALLADAIQAHRPWARDIERECLRRGANHEVTAYGKRRQPRVAVAYNGRIVRKSRRRGAAERTDDGGRIHQQILWEEMSWPQIEALLRNRIVQMRSLGHDVRIVRRLEALHEKYPATFGVAEALALEGCSLDEWLGVEDTA